ncbi:MAG: hypothetical protein AAB263_03375, partial [Planctomycetota bacterium]
LNQPLSPQPIGLRLFPRLFRRLSCRELTCSTGIRSAIRLTAPWTFLQDTLCHLMVYTCPTAFHACSVDCLAAKRSSAESAGFCLYVSLPQGFPQLQGDSADATRVGWSGNDQQFHDRSKMGCGCSHTGSTHLFGPICRAA